MSDPQMPTPQAGASAATPNPTTAKPASVGRVLLIHGYSAQGTDLQPWKQALEDAGINAIPIEIGNYITLNNEVTIKDLGEAFDRALRWTPWSSGTKDDVWTFDAIVHSTGMLVLRQWLTNDPFPHDQRSRVRRLKHLVGLAPASFGSPQAAKGRSWLGALVKGNKQLGPDFLNAGDKVLDGLEIASKFTWDLTHKDLLANPPLYSLGSDTPYVSIFIGNHPYTGIAAVSNSPGTDGTVRWAGCALDTRKVTVDLRQTPKTVDDSGKLTRCAISTWQANRLPAPIIAVEGQNHGTIVSAPNTDVATFIHDFFQITSDEAYTAWSAKTQAFGQAARAKMDSASVSGNDGGAGWQQLLIRVVDDHLDGVPDYNVRIFVGEALEQSDDPEFPSVPLIADTYSGDASYRCFYVRLTDTMLNLNAPGTTPRKMWLELIASSGSDLLEYEAYTGAANDPQRMTIDHAGGHPVKLDITHLAEGDARLLYPYTTTLLEIFVEREPMPLGKVSDIFTFPNYGG